MDVIKTPSLTAPPPSIAVSVKPVGLVEAPSDAVKAAPTDLPKLDTEGLVSQLQSKYQHIQRDLNFSVDEGTGSVVVKVLDGDSGKVIRQIPSEDLLKLAERMDDVRSLMLNEKA